VECEEKEPEDKGLSRKNMNFSVPPSENFFLYANGGWIEANPIPAGYPSWNTFLTLHVKSQENLKELLAGLAEKDGLSVDEAKVSAFYAAALDEEAIEQASLQPMEPLLSLCTKISEESTENKAAYAKMLGEMSAKYGVSPFFCIGASPDNKNSDHSLCQVSQGGLGLPDRDYYFDEDKEEKRVAYKKHIAMMLTLLDNPTASEPTEASLAAADEVYALELRLAEAHMTKTECRDPEATYNKMSASDLTKNGDDSFDFASYFVGATGKSTEELGDINVRNTAALKRVAEVASSVENNILLNYLRWASAKSCAPYLSKAFVDESFNFYEKTLSGTDEIKPRWKRAMEFTESALGEALGQLYCAEYFDEECKGRALKIVEDVRAALEERLKEVEWMGEATREAGLKKMAGFKVKIGYPDKWIDYTTLDIKDTDSFLGMVFKARAFEHARKVKEMNAPTDREKWFLTPQTVNAYYHPSLNEIVFPAAILQPPFFNREADDAVNYGAMGAVVGHEMTHGFDDKGRKFNFEGNMIDWWTEEDAKEYESRVEVMINQANAFKVHGQSVQGKLTCGENIADLGGLNLAYRALKAQKGFDSWPMIDGFTPTQRFFLGWAQCWRQNVTKERALQLLTLDPHGPNEMRCNGPLSNIPAFHEAFEIPESSAMFKTVDNRVDIW
jgi:putative endopeptidase